jgi:uncharacterized protein (TIGR02145 family)
MKRFYFLITAALIALNSFGQAPACFKYQTIVRDAEGNIRASVNLVIEIAILQMNANGLQVYSESHDTVTNEFGLVNLLIGSKNTVEFSNIDWSNGPYFVKISVDGIVMGTSQLLSVPYAKYADKAGNGFSGDYNDLNNKPDFMQTLSDKGVIVIDYDGNIYSTVRIGSQIWMAENLRTKHLNDGEAIPVILNDKDWNNQPFPACFEMYMGNYYNWYVVESRKLCPIGWGVPSFDAWKILSDFLGGEDVAGGKMKTGGFGQGNIGATNESGFTATASGSISPGGIGDQVIGYTAGYWSSTQLDSINAVRASVVCFSARLGIGSGPNKTSGYSVRCIKDQRTF